MHRDLKPANIKVRPDGTVKVLDFGMAKLTRSPRREGEPGTDGTGVGHGCLYGARTGARRKGRQEDGLWAFGAVLYEMLSGQRPFRGGSPAEVVASVLKEEPDYTMVPARVRRLIRSCLEKDPRKRLRDVVDGLRLLVDEDQPAPSRQRRITLAMAWRCGRGGRSLASTAGLPLLEARPAPVSRSVSFQILPEGIVRYHSLALFSPDGRKLAFTGEGLDGVERLWIRDFDSLAIHTIPEGDGAGPIWSPDSKHLAFVARGKLRKIRLDRRAVSGVV